MSPEILNLVLAKLQSIEKTVSEIAEHATKKDWYTTIEVGKILGKAPYTVREYCRLGRIEAKRKDCGRGVHGEWIISREELERVMSEGLRPMLARYGR